MYETFNEQENSFILSNPYHFHELDTNELEGAYSSHEDDIFVEDVHCGLSTENDLFGYNFKKKSDPINDALAKENKEYSPCTFLDFEDSVNIHEEEEKASKDFNIISDFLCSETIENPDRVFFGDEVEQHVPYEQDEISYEGSHGDMSEHSMFSSPLFEKDILGKQISQLYNENNIPNDNVELDTIRDVYLKNPVHPMSKECNHANMVLKVLQMSYLIRFLIKLKQYFL